MHRKYVQGKRNRANKGNNRQQHQVDKVKHSPLPTKMVQSDIPQQNVEFLSRVVNIPVVHSAIEYATDAYIKAKVKVNNSSSWCNVSLCVIV